LWQFSRKICLGDETSVAYISLNANSLELKIWKQTYFVINFKLLKSEPI